MRTTLNIDDDVASELGRLAQRDGRSLSRTANELLRSGLQSRRATPKLDPYVPPVFETGQALMDVTDAAAVLDLLDELDGRRI